MAEPPISEAVSQAQGEQAAQQQLDDFRKNAAYNALVQTYGPAAGDPEAWAKSAQAKQTQDVEPYAAPTAQADLQGKQLGNADQTIKNQDALRQQQGQALYSVTQMAKTAANPDGSIDPAKYDQLFSNPLVQKATGVTPDEVAQAKPLITSPGGTTHLDAIGSAALGAQKVSGAVAYGQNADGTSYAIEHDAMGRLSKVPIGDGVTPTAVTNANSGQQRVKQGWQRTAQGWRRVDIGQQNANTNAYNAGVRSNNSQYGAPDGTAPPQQGAIVAPAAAPAPSTDERSQAAAALLKQYHNNPDAAIQNAPDDATAQAVADLVTKNHSQAPAAPAVHGSAAPAIPQLSGKPLATRTGAAQQIVAGQVNLDNANSIAGSMAKQITPYTTGAGSLMSSLPGSVANDLRRNAQTLKAQAAQAVLQGMKNNQGSTGIGRVLQAEYQNFTNMYGNMEQDQSTKQFQYHLGLLQHSLNKMTQIQRAGFRAQWKTDPESALGMEPRHASGSGPIKTGARLPGGFTVVKVQ